MEDFMFLAEDDMVEITCRYCGGRWRRLCPETTVCGQWECCRTYFSERGSAAAIKAGLNRTREVA